MNGDVSRCGLNQATKKLTAEARKRADRLLQTNHKNRIMTALPSHNYHSPKS